MISISGILGAVILLWIFLYTESYGMWIYKNGNRTGGVAVIIVAVFSVILPIISVMMKK